MATYREIREWVRDKYGFVPQDCWIAHVKETVGLPVRRAHERNEQRLKPCPEDKQTPIKEALKNFRII